MISADLLLSEVAAHHTVVMYPSYGHLSEDGQTWKLHLHGVILEPGEITLQKRILLRLLRQVMNAEPADFQTELFQRRVHGFVAAGNAGRQIAVQIGARTYLLQKRSKRNGHFSGTVRLSIAHVRDLEAAGVIEDGWVRFHVVTRDDDQRELSGRCLLVPPRGTSVISDIDDTIKHTEVANRRSLLVNTFLHEFRCIDGMSSVYRDWAERGAVFHYVSSSPWQLFDPLAELCLDAGFPMGTMHLRMFRLRDHMLRRMLLIRRKGKGAVMRSLFHAFPERRFVLVGDSGERDPEIYALLARTFPQQIERILIRQLGFRRLDGERWLKVSRHVATERWQLFEEAAEIPGDAVDFDRGVPRLIV